MLRDELLSPAVLNVFITIDTEMYPRTRLWRETALAREIEREVFGLNALRFFGR